MDRRLTAFFVIVALVLSGAGYVLVQNRSGSSTVVDASPATIPSSPQAPTTTSTPPTTRPVRSTLPPTPSSPIFDYAADGGCTPGSMSLPDGEFYGSVVINEDRSMAFNLKCLFRAEDLPDNFEELYAVRFPGETFPGTGFDLIDPAAAQRRVRFTWQSQFTLDQGLYVGDEAYLWFVAQDSTPFDAKIVVEGNVATTITKLS
jgi:hypothetical protein